MPGQRRIQPPLSGCSRAKRGRIRRPSDVCMLTFVLERCPRLLHHGHLMKKGQCLLAILLFSMRVTLAEEPTTQPAKTAHVEIPLWPGGAPGSEGKVAQEIVATNANGEQTVWGIHN